MGILLSCDSIRLEFPTKRVFDCVTLGIDEGDAIGIVGRNGDGKSTLLSVLSGAVAPDEGRVTRRRGVRVGLLGQSDSLAEDETVAHEVVGDAPEYEWAGDARVRGILSALLADVPWDARIRELSGGQRRRVDLARLLIGDYDVLMLDEPTNHLDVRAIDWLARHLRERWTRDRGALLVVTHDRWFLDEVCTYMWEVHDGKVDGFEGGYSAYILARAERDRLAAVAEERRRNMVRKELAWLSRGAQARSTKAKFRVDAARALIADVPPLRNELELKRLAVSRLGKQVIDLEDVCAGYGGAPVLDHVTWRIGAGDRYGVLGVNGAGKSTLLSVVQGLVEPSSGRVRIGQTVRFGVLSQRLSELDGHEDDTVQELLRRCKRTYVVDGRETSPEKLFERLGFTAKQQFSRIRDLSGGQRRRIMLLLVLLQEPNVLILDEPGNDLDTDMLAVVEDLLDGWPGTLILVSHDRYLMERVTDDQFALIDGHVRHVPGGVEEYLRLVGPAGEGSMPPLKDGGRAGSGAASAPAPSDDAGGAAQVAAAVRSLSRSEEYRLRKQVSSLERKMETQRGRIAELERAMGDIDPTDYASLERQQGDIDAARSALEELETEWLEASEELEG